MKWRYCKRYLIERATNLLLSLYLSLRMQSPLNQIEPQRLKNSQKAQRTDNYGHIDIDAMRQELQRAKEANQQLLLRNQQLEQQMRQTVKVEPATDVHMKQEEHREYSLISIADSISSAVYDQQETAYKAEGTNQCEHTCQDTAFCSPAMDTHNGQDNPVVQHQREDAQYQISNNQYLRALILQFEQISQILDLSFQIEPFVILLKHNLIKYMELNQLNCVINQVNNPLMLCYLVSRLTTIEQNLLWEILASQFGRYCQYIILLFKTLLDATLTDGSQIHINFRQLDNIQFMFNQNIQHKVEVIDKSQDWQKKRIYKWSDYTEFTVAIKDAFRSIFKENYDGHQPSQLCDLINNKVCTSSKQVQQSFWKRVVSTCQKGQDYYLKTYQRLNYNEIKTTTEKMNIVAAWQQVKDDYSDIDSAAKYLNENSFKQYNYYTQCVGDVIRKSQDLKYQKYRDYCIIKNDSQKNFCIQVNQIYKQFTIMEDTLQLHQQQLDDLKAKYYYKLYKTSLIKVLQEELNKNQFMVYELANNPSDKFICYATYTILYDLCTDGVLDYTGQNIYLWRDFAMELSQQLFKATEFDFRDTVTTNFTTAQRYQEYFDQTFKNMTQNQIIDYFDMIHAVFYELNLDNNDDKNKSQSE
ncbi:Hypothetical_protein [Hexamita inflata]|uniref:Hypothetical_protein n=1 Tax=Hexamita inflata TaxID=28002 RepID=A0AA86RHH0_9EUKA|nr:Hypothetical protein HINF_LOCUS61178 [Hexamita inflata]